MNVYIVRISRQFYRFVKNNKIKDYVWRPYGYDG